MFERFFKNRYGYSRWDGTQRIDGLDADEFLDALSDEYLDDGDLQKALRRLLQNGVRTDDGRQTLGLRDMLERMRRRRQDQLSRYNMASGVMDDLREKLEEIKSLERAGIQKRLDDPEDAEVEDRNGESSPEDGEALSLEQIRKMLEMIARRKQDYLDNLPQDIPGQIKGLSEYDFMDSEAREKFKELMESLQQQMMQRRVRQKHPEEAVPRRYAPAKLDLRPPRQQHNRPLKRSQQLLGQLVHNAKFRCILHTLHHDRKRFLHSPLPFAQLLDSGFISRVTCQVKPAQPLHRHDRSLL